MTIWKRFTLLLNIAGAFPFYALATFLAILVPKRPALVLVMAREDGAFADNAKYAYFNLEEQRQLDLRFVTYRRRMAKELRQAGIRAVHFPSPAAVWLCLRAAAAIGVDYGPFRGFLGHLISRARTIQLWHGSGIKNVSMDSPGRSREMRDPLFRLKLKVRRTFPRFHRIYFPSASLLERRRDTFRYRHAALNGLLRNDLILGRSFGGRERLGTDRHCGEVIARARAAGRKIVLFAPTWRTRRRSDIGARIPFDFRRIDRLMVESGALLVVKLHPAMPDALDLEPFPNIIEYDRHADIYPDMGAADLMVSDFSSIVPDFALTGRPVILYLPDLDLLIEEQRFSPANLAAFIGEECRSFDELCGLLSERLGEAGQPAAGRHPNLAAFHDFLDARSGERFVRDILAEAEG